MLIALVVLLALVALAAMFCLGCIWGRNRSALPTSAPLPSSDPVTGNAESVEPDATSASDLRYLVRAWTELTESEAWRWLETEARQNVRIADSVLHSCEPSMTGTVTKAQLGVMVWSGVADLPHLKIQALTRRLSELEKEELHG
jgi:hypothetical protein